MATYDNAPTSNETSRRYTAALMAIQYGMFDAVIDWGLTYTVMYAIIGGLTWYNVDSSFLMVIWGFSLMCSALILAVAGLKIPEWLGFYRKSQLKTIRDTSGYAEKAVEELSADGGTIAAFRYQVRLGIGKHFSQFAWFLLPFYTNLKVWFYLLSILIGFVIGQLFIFIVFKCRQRFRQRRGLVALGASAVVALGSAASFVRGVDIVNKGWVRTHAYVSLHLRAASRDPCSNFSHTPFLAYHRIVLLGSHTSCFQFVSSSGWQQLRCFMEGNTMNNASSRRTKMKLLYLPQCMRVMEELPSPTMMMMGPRLKMHWKSLC